MPAQPRRGGKEAAHPIAVSCKNKPRGSQPLTAGEPAYFTSSLHLAGEEEWKTPLRQSQQAGPELPPPLRVAAGCRPVGESDSNWTSKVFAAEGNSTDMQLFFCPTSSASEMAPCWRRLAVYKLVRICTALGAGAWQVQTHFGSNDRGNSGRPRHLLPCIWSENG